MLLNTPFIAVLAWTCWPNLGVALFWERLPCTAVGMVIWSNSTYSIWWDVFRFFPVIFRHLCYCSYMLSVFSVLESAHCRFLPSLSWWDEREENVADHEENVAGQMCQGSVRRGRRRNCDVAGSLSFLRHKSPSHTHIHTYYLRCKFIRKHRAILWRLCLQ